MIVLYAGRRPDPTSFPEANEQFVAGQVARVLRGLMPRLVVGSAAAGADIVVLERALELGIAARVILAGSTKEFADSSVADKGAEWRARYDAVLASERVEVVELPRVAADDEASYRAVTDRIWAAVADEGDAAVVLSVSGRREGGGHAEDLARREANAGGVVIGVDPARTWAESATVFVAMPFGESSA